MDNHHIEAIIFDLGRVLIDFDHRIAARKISKFSKKTPEEIFSLFFESEITLLFEQGKILPQDFFLKVKKILDLELDYDGFVPIWNEIFFLSDKNHAVYKLTKSLKKRYKLALLSNINILHFDYLKKNFSVFDTFDIIFTSFKLGLIKPQPLIYQKALARLKVSSASSVFYTDDREELVKEAGKLGIKSVVFKDPVQLRRALEDAGVNIN